MKRRYHVTIETPQELNQSSYFRTGLFELEKTGLIKCNVKLTIAPRPGRLDTNTGSVIRSNHSHTKTSYYRFLDCETKKLLYFGVDSFDAAWLFSEYAVDNCDFIFKRNYQSNNIEPFAEAIRSRIYPMGLSFMIGNKEDSSRARFFTGLVLSNLLISMKFDRRLISRAFKSLKWSVQHWKNISAARLLRDFEIMVSPKNPGIIFQTRCFSRVGQDDTLEIHEQRAQLIRHLRKDFGSVYLGGFIPESISRKYYPDCLTSLPTAPDLYLKLVNETSIGIYSRGLLDSPAWKLAEYLAKGTCCVAEKLNTELPYPLEHGKQLFFFKSFEECTAYCRHLLTNKDLLERMSENARAYYDKYISPAANAKRVLELMSGESLS